MDITPSTLEKDRRCEFGLWDHWCYHSKSDNPKTLIAFKGIKAMLTIEEFTDRDRVAILDHLIDDFSLHRCSGGHLDTERCQCMNDE